MSQLRDFTNKLSSYEWAYERRVKRSRADAVLAAPDRYILVCLHEKNAEVNFTSLVPLNDDIHCQES